MLSVADGLGGLEGEILVNGSASQLLKGADLGGGIFEITNDTNLFVFKAGMDDLLG